MTSPRKHPSLAFWITAALVAVLVGCPLSFGPACWLSDRDVVPYGLADTVYRPLVTMGMYTHCDRAVEWYGTCVELPELPPNPDVGTDCRLYTAVQIRLNLEQNR
jgi:hypothetical protein